MVAKYREIYRAREYKSMLKSILAGPELKSEWKDTVSGSQYTANIARAQIGSGLISNSILQQTATAQLNANFDEAYRNVVQAKGASS
jgi:hypothetical protein